MRLKHIAYLIAATLMTCAFVFVRLQIVRTSYDINTLSEKEKQLREDCNSLALKINEAKSPQKLEHLAKNKFHMVPPRPEQVVGLTGAPPEKYQ